MHQPLGQLHVQYNRKLVGQIHAQIGRTKFFLVKQRASRHLKKKTIL